LFADKDGVFPNQFKQLMLFFCIVPSLKVAPKCNHFLKKVMAKTQSKPAGQSRNDLLL
jgi:hypothetical protein